MDTDTIEQLLQIARDYTGFAVNNENFERRAVFAQIAQAAAQTVQAEILYAASRTSVGERRIVYTFTD